MVYVLENVLSEPELAWLRATLAETPFVDGKLTAGDQAAQVKHNEEVDIRNPEAMQRLARLFMTAYGRHPVFRSAALPLHVATPVFARYRPGMAYGDHVDETVMGMSGKRFRTDVATTLFINDPDRYEGGELVIQTSFGEQRIKRPAGQAVLYPASSLRRVTEVASGERLVAVSWIQSMVRDPAQRELLHELNAVRETRMKETSNGETTRQLDRCYANLMRMWVEPS